MKHRLLAALIFVGLIATTPVFAHAFLDHAEPAVGATVAKPTQISIWFTEDLEPAFSAIEVTDADGGRVDTGDTHIDSANPKLLHVSLKSLAAGTYKVSWHVVSVDTHRTQGDFSFTVAP
jgi:copper resistance protein C